MPDPSARGGGRGGPAVSYIYTFVAQKKIVLLPVGSDYNASIMKEILIGLLAGLVLGISLTLVLQSKNTNTSRYQIIPIETLDREEVVGRTSMGVIKAIRLDTVTGETFPLRNTLRGGSNSIISADHPVEYQTAEE